MAPVTEEALRARLDRGELVEGPEYATSAYVESLQRTLIVSADTELISAPAYLRAAQDAPSINSYISAIGIIQDELGHAHIAYRMLRDLGVDTDALIYERDPAQFKHPFAFDVPLESWTELVVANAFYDRAGFVLLGDIYRHTTYGPWKRALAKVDREENFHLRHGEKWMHTLAAAPAARAELQRAVDWMFLLTVEWFGLPDDLKRHKEQIGYGLKGCTNDELRQQWLSTAVPLCQALGLEVPARYDPSARRWVITCPFPARFDAAQKRWRLEEGATTWDEVVGRWRQRGPANAELVAEIQRGYRQLQQLQA
ncbi:MAG: Phenylacetic acid catabolic protein [Armatimonadota bacterium]|nr:Phenylacetic acid catabolic protein [Armatimonadota bacterium]